MKDKKKQETMHKQVSGAVAEIQCLEAELKSLGSSPEDGERSVEIFDDLMTLSFGIGGARKHLATGGRREASDGQAGAAGDSDNGQ